MYLVSVDPMDRSMLTYYDSKHKMFVCSNRTAMLLLKEFEICWWSIGVNNQPIKDYVVVEKTVLILVDGLLYYIFKILGWDHNNLGWKYCLLF